jgi:hypothetical protein
VDFLNINVQLILCLFAAILHCVLISFSPIMSFPLSCLICNCSVQPTEQEWKKHENGKSHRKKLNSSSSSSSSKTPDAVQAISSSSSSSSLHVTYDLLDDVCLAACGAACSSSLRTNPRKSLSLTHSGIKLNQTHESQDYSEISSHSSSYSHVAQSSTPASSQPSSLNHSNIQSLSNREVTACTTKLSPTSTSSHSSSSPSPPFRALSPLSSEFNPVLDLPPYSLVEWSRIERLSMNDRIDNELSHAGVAALTAYQLMDAAYRVRAEFASISPSLSTFDQSQYPGGFDFTAYALLCARNYSSQPCHVNYTLSELKLLSSSTSCSSSSAAAISVTASVKSGASSQCNGKIAPCSAFNLFRPCMHTPFYCPVCVRDLHTSHDLLVHLRHPLHVRQLRLWNDRENAAIRRHESDVLNARLAAIAFGTDMPVESETAADLSDDYVYDYRGRFVRDDQGDDVDCADFDDLADVYEAAYDDDDVSDDDDDGDDY